ncbi:hypothetical protein KIMH_11800 [Bombiscardovia apis]|uniref:ABC3 transporter permease C-terminal domain-containing protein n=1 Tax=Bombiscardovia apis TaxID=2932182 RepID=A0ABM8BDS8_9BIFI|nr:ABC transporter permease [Bombiscardovia apis]BDR55069.1 hypothetical protein KIMH_11800 [Bombiscardovia apis]
MRAIAKSLRSAPGVWIGVFLYLSVVQSVMGAITMVASSYQRTYASVQGDLHQDAENMVHMMEYLELPLTVIIGVFITLWVVSAAVRNQRKQLALLSMQGATPSQLTLLTEAQVLILGIAATVLSAVVDGFAVPPFFRYMTSTYSDFADSYYYQPDVTAWLLGAGVGLATAAVGTALTVRAAAKVDPVEAYRPQAVSPKNPGWVRTLLSLSSFVGAIYVFVLPVWKVRRASLSGGKAAMDAFNTDTSMVLTCAMGGLMLLMIAFAFLAPLLYGGLVRLWTQLLPIPASPWVLAKRQTVSRIERSSSVLAPLMACLGLIMGMGTPMQIYSASLMKVAGYSTPPGTTSTGLAGILGAVGPAALIALGGALAGFCMISRERSFDQSLLDIAGAEPRQLRSMAVLEGSIIMFTAILAAFLITIPATASAYVGIRIMLGTGVLSVPWALWGWIALGVAILGSAIFFIASARALRTPSIAVIQLQAE